MPAPKVKHRLGFYSRANSLRNVDLRTPEAKMIIRFRDEMFAQFGGADRIAPTRLAVIEATAVLRFRMHAAVVKFLRGEASAELDLHFVAVQRALVQNCALLGLDMAQAQPLTLEAYVAANYDKVA